MRRHDARNLPGDLFAGMTAVFAAQAIACSRLAHATPTAGLVTAIAGAAVYTLLGSSLRMSIGPAGGIAAIVGTSVAGVPPEHLLTALAALTLMTAGFLLLGRLLRVSFLQRLFPTPVFWPRRSFTALGATSLVAGLLGGFVAGCSTSRSLVGIRAGEKTRLAAAVAALLLLLTALSVVRLRSPMPLAALAAVVFVAVFDLINVPKLREMWRLRRADFVIAVVAGLAVVLVGMVEGVVVGVAAALIEAFRRAMQPHRSLIARQAGERVYEPFTVDAVKQSDDLLIQRFGAGLCELEASRIQMAFGNVRADLRAALNEIGSFTVLHEAELIADPRKVRSDRP